MDNIIKETAEERFKRLATRRTNEILRKVRILGNCSNRQAYKYTEEDVDKIFSVIENAVKKAKAKFHFPKKEEFKL